MRWDEEVVRLTFNGLEQTKSNLEDFKKGKSLDKWDKEDIEQALYNIGNLLDKKKVKDGLKYFEDIIEFYFNKGKNYVKEEQLILSLVTSQKIEDAFDSVKELEEEVALSYVGRDVYLQDLVVSISLLHEIDREIKNSSAKVVRYKYRHFKQGLTKSISKGLNKRGINKKDIVENTPARYVDWLINPANVLDKKENKVLKKWYKKIGLDDVETNLNLENQNTIYQKTIAYIFREDVKGSKSMDKVNDELLNKIIQANNEGRIENIDIKALPPKGTMITVGEEGQIFIRIYKDLTVLSDIKGTGSRVLYKKPFSGVKISDIDQLIEFLEDN